MPEQQKKSVIVTKMARNENMNLAQAAELAAHDVHGLTESYLRFNDAMKDTAIDEWSRLKRTSGEALGEFFQTNEPAMAKMIKMLEKFSKVVLPGLIKGFAVVFAGLALALIQPLIIIGGLIMGIGKLSSLVKDWDKKAKTPEKRFAVPDIDDPESYATGDKFRNIIKPEKVTKIHEQVFKKLSKISKYYYVEQTKNITKNSDAFVAAAVSMESSAAAAAEKGYYYRSIILLEQAKELRGYIKLIKHVDEYNQHQQNIKNQWTIRKNFLISLVQQLQNIILVAKNTIKTKLLNSKKKCFKCKEYLQKAKSFTNGSKNTLTRKLT